MDYANLKIGIDIFQTDVIDNLYVALKIKLYIEADLKMKCCQCSKCIRGIK